MKMLPQDQVSGLLTYQLIFLRFLLIFDFLDVIRYKFRGQEQVKYHT